MWGAQGENCARFLSKGRPIAIDGRLEWREWQDQDGNKRQAVEIVADTVQFLGGRDEARAAAATASPRSRRPGGQRRLRAGGGDRRRPAADNDIPF